MYSPGAFRSASIAKIIKAIAKIYSVLHTATKWISMIKMSLHVDIFAVKNVPSVPAQQFFFIWKK